MKKKAILILVLLLYCSIMLTGCDPIFPSENIKIVSIETLNQGDIVDIEIVYPTYKGALFTLEWKEQNIEIISGDDIIHISGLHIIGLKPGIALIKISAIGHFGPQEKVYSTEVEITVK